MEGREIKAPADGRTIVFHYTYNGCTGDYFESATCRIQLDDSNNSTGSICRGRLANGSAFAQFDDAVIETCSGVVLRGGGGGQCRGVPRGGPASRCPQRRGMRHAEQVTRPSKKRKLGSSKKGRPDDPSDRNEKRLAYPGNLRRGCNAALCLPASNP